MNLPFTSEEFFTVFRQYNEGVWATQIVLVVLALSVWVTLFFPYRQSHRVIAAILALLWVWMAVAYHFLFFTSINSAAWAFGGFFLLQAGLLSWYGVFRGMLIFNKPGDFQGLCGQVLVLFSLVLYPLLSYLMGHRYPATPTFGLPCPTTIFTLGILLGARSPLPVSLFVIPLAWVLIGSVAALELGVLQDFSLTMAGAITLGFLVYNRVMGKQTDQPG